MGDSSLLSVLVDIQHQTTTQSTIGGASLVWATTHADVAAKVSPLTGEDIAAYAAQDWKATDAIYFFTDYSLKPNVDRITIESEQFVIRDVKHFKGKRLEHWKVIAERQPL